MIKEMVGSRIKDIRIEKCKLSQEVFSEKLHIDRTYLSRIESGKQNLTIENLIMICNGLDVSLSDFFKPFKSKFIESKSSACDKAKFTFIDLFAGIGGFHIAMHNIGGKCVFVSEWDDDCRKTYSTNFKAISPEIFDPKKEDVSFVGDITKIKPKDIPDHDVLCAGFPCQPFSQAGFKKGFEDTRGTLFFNIAEIIKEKNPKAVFLENVRGLLNHDDGRTFEVISNTIAELGYKMHYKIVKASDFDCPQHRPRLFMICFRNDIDDSDFVFPEPIPLKKNMSQVFDGAEVNREVGFTLRVGGKHSPIDDRRNWDGYIVNGKEVRISPKEGKRMQGFPDKFIFPVSNSIAMKQLGNSVAIPAIQAVGEKMISILEDKKIYE